MKEAGFLLFCTASIAGCEAPSSDAGSAVAGLKAADRNCALPTTHFAASLQPLVGTRLGYPIDRVEVDENGRLRWNNALVEPMQLKQYLPAHEAARSPIFLLVRSHPDAPCSLVRETLSAAVEVGGCNPQACAFEWRVPMVP